MSRAPDAELLEAATLEWLESVRRRQPAPGAFAVYGADLALVAQATALVEDDRRREGILLSPGELTVERIEVLTDAPDGPQVYVDATIVFPADVATDPVAPGRALGELTVSFGTVYFDSQPEALRIVDYTRSSQRMSAMWCTHPEGEDAKGGLAAVPQAVTLEAHRGGRLFLEVTSVLERDVILRVGRPDRPKGWFKRQPPVEAPEAGIPLPAGGTTHLVGLTRRSRLTEVEIFAFDAADRSPLAALLVPIELPKGHPGEHGQWCG